MMNRLIALAGAPAVLSVLLAFGTATAQQLPGVETVPRPGFSHDELALGEVEVNRALAFGRDLFDARWTVEDGAGRPLASAAEIPTRRRPSETPAFFRTSGPDAAACGGCHLQPVLGGAGEFAMNAFIAPQDLEWDFQSVAPDLSMERGTTHLFGAGLLELLAREMTRDLHALRDAAVAEARATGDQVEIGLETKGVSFGALTALPDGSLDLRAVEGVHADLIVKPFGQKAVVPSLRQFTVTAFNSHHGMQSDERFGAGWTGDADFDGDGVAAELSDAEVTATTLFQATLPIPTRTPPEDPFLREAAEAGEVLFTEVGCAACHISALPLESAVFTEPGPYNTPGTLRPHEADELVAVDLIALWEQDPLLSRLERDAEGRLLVPAFTDLKRHVIADAERPFFANELITQNFVPRDQFRTAPLWGIGSTAPYGHRGDLTTLREAIHHHGGAATEARQAFDDLSAYDQGAIIEFLMSLTLPERLPSFLEGPSS